MKTAEPRAILLAGPTAVGKSAVALRLAELLDGEIVTVDSMQVYRGLDIGTAKPSASERARIPHHLIDIADLSESFDAAQFAQRATAIAAEILGRGRTPILCGGTGLYFAAFLHGVGEAPPADLQLRRELKSRPLPELLEELRTKDPATYERIDRANLRRILRALEVIRLTGKPFSEQRAQWPDPEDAGSNYPAFGLSRGAADLKWRIDQRVDEMFQRGLVEETRALLGKGLERNQTAMQAIGYRQVVEYLREQRSLEETIATVKSRTRKFAKRQMTWFRLQMKLDWLELQPDEDPRETAAAIAAILRRSPS